MPSPTRSNMADGDQEGSEVAPSTSSPRKSKRKKLKTSVEKYEQNDYMPDAPDLTEELKDNRTDFELMLAANMETERDEARIDRLLVREKTHESAHQIRASKTGIT